MESVLQDLRHGLRVLARSPGSSAVAIVALALGIGANTAIFSLVHAALLEPLPYRDADGLVQVWEDASHYGFPHNTPSPANFLDWKAKNHVFEDMAASRADSFALTGTGGDPEMVVGRSVTGNTFALLGVRPVLGRGLTVEDDRPGGPAVAVIAHALWQRRFGGATDIVGKTVDVDGRPTTILGVMGRGFAFPFRDQELWVPIAFSTEMAQNRNAHFLQVIARLRPGVTLARAKSDLSAIAAQLERDHPDSNKQLGAAVVALRDEVVGDVRPALFVLLAAVGCVLLIACVNVANLLLSRATLRTREMAVRLALGAGRGRIVRQLLTESVLLAAAGGALGLGVALWSFDLLRTLIPSGTAPTAGLALDWTVLAYTAAVSLVTGVAFGMAPALAATRHDLATELKAAGSRGASPATGRLHGGLVVAEVALAFLLLAGSALMVQAFVHVRGLDPGFQAENLLTVRTVLPSPRYDEAARRNAFYDRVLERVAALPGVVSAGYTSFLPLTLRGGGISFAIENGPPPDGNQQQSANLRVISADYVRTMSIVLRAGRPLAAHENQPVTLVNETFAHVYFGATDPLGRRIKQGSADSDEPWMTIVGVVGDVRQMGLENPTRAEMYVPYNQHTGHIIFSPKDLAVKVAGGDAMAMADAVRRAVWEADPLEPVADVRPMSKILDLELAGRSTQTRLLGAFAALALVLASLGIYGVLAHTVAQRRREIGIRMALGAPPARVVHAVVGRGLLLALIGVAIGLGGALVALRALSSLLYGITATDPLTYAAVAAFLTAISGLASYLPARQAARVDPMIALRAE